MQTAESIFCAAMAFLQNSLKTPRSVKNYSMVTFVFFVVVVIKKSSVNSRDVLQTIKPDLFFKTRRSWHRYVDEFVFREFRSQPNLFNSHIKRKLFQQLKNSKMFKTFSLARSSCRICNVTKATGQLFCSVSRKENSKNLTGHWTFKLDKMLALNLSFGEIWFSTSSVYCPTQWCRFGNLSIQNMGDTKGGFLFCGHMATFMIFPDFREVMITISTERFAPVSWRIIVKFSAVDPSLATTIDQNKNSPLTFLSVQQTQILRREHILFSCLIQMHKIFCVFLQTKLTAETKFLFFDGPGVLSPIVSKGPNFTSSTFQCFLQVLFMCSKNISRQTDQMFQFSPVEVNFRTISATTSATTFLVLPSLWCDTNICGLSGHSQIGFQVNVTLTRMQYKGVNITSCSRGGLAIGEMFYDNKYNESLTVCQNHSNFQRQNRSFYSQNGSIRLILYQYKEYSSVMTEISISETKCKAVQLNTCFINKLCIVDENKTFCHSFLQQISHSSTVEFFYQWSWHFHGILFSLNRGSCAVIQSSRKFLNCSEPEETWSSCFFEFSQKPSLHSSGEIQYDFKGSFSTETIGFFVSGNVDYMCYLRGNVPESSCTTSYCKRCHSTNCNSAAKSEDVDMCTTTEFGSARQFLVTFKVNQPVYVGSLVFEFSLSRYSQDWYEIVMSDSVTEMAHQMPWLENWYSAEEIKPKIFQYEDQILLIKGNALTQNKTTLSVFLDFDTTHRATWQDKYRYESLIVDFSLFFSHANMCKYVALPGTPHCLILGPSKLFSNGTTLWGFKHFSEKLVALVIDPQKCTQDFRTLFSCSYCLNYTSQNYLYLQKCETHSFLLMVSWTQASKLCREAGGHLPSFNSRDEMEAFVALLKLSLDMPALLSVFIGLVRTCPNSSF